MRKGNHFVVAIAWLVFVGYACRDLGDEPGKPSTQPSAVVAGKVTAPGEVPLSEMVVYLESPEADRKIAAARASVKVSQKGAKFSPAVVIVCVGQSVDFVNDEDRAIEHNVFSNASVKKFDLGLYKPGESRSVTFDKVGAVFLYCSIHRHMDGVVFVSPTPFSSRVKEDGSYRIEGVPPGIWVVKTWQRRRHFPELSTPVLAELAKVANVDLELHRK